MEKLGILNIPYEEGYLYFVKRVNGKLGIFRSMKHYLKKKMKSEENNEQEDETFK